MEALSRTALGIALLAVLAGGCGPWGPQGVFAGGPLPGEEQPFPAD